MDEKIPNRHWKLKPGARDRGRATAIANRKAKKVREGFDVCNVGSEYSEDQQEWIRAVMQFQQKHRRYPTMQEAFALAVVLGYRKQEGGE